MNKTTQTKPISQPLIKSTAIKVLDKAIDSYPTNHPERQKIEIQKQKYIAKHKLIK
jgi:hypothetical protein